jgi:hypothetical protein
MRAEVPQDITASFNSVLDSIVAGELERVPSETGLDQQTIDILNLLAAQREKLPTDIAACRAEFGRQLDGTHAEENDAEVLKLLLGQ